MLQQLWIRQGRTRHGHSPEVMRRAGPGRGNVRPVPERLQSAGLVRTDEDGTGSLTARGTVTESKTPGAGAL